MKLGSRHSLTTAQRMSIAQRARWADPEYRERMLKIRRDRHPVPAAMWPAYTHLLRKGFRRAEVLQLLNIQEKT